MNNLFHIDIIGNILKLEIQGPAVAQKVDSHPISKQTPTAAEVKRVENVESN